MNTEIFNLKDGHITGEEIFKGKKMTKDEYLSLIHFDKRTDINNAVYRLCPDDMVDFYALCNNAEKNRTLLPIIIYTDGVEDKETVEMIW